LATSKSDRQHRAKNDESDKHGGAQHPQLKFGKHWQSPHRKSESIDDMRFQMKSSENAEELTATAPLQFGRQSMNETEKTQYIPAPSNILQSEGDCEVS